MSSRLRRAIAESDRRREREATREERRRHRRRTAPDSAPVGDGAELIEDDMLLDIPDGGGGDVWGWLTEAR